MSTASLNYLIVAHSEQQFYGSALGAGGLHSNFALVFLINSSASLTSKSQSQSGMAGTGFLGAVFGVSGFAIALSLAGLVGEAVVVGLSGVAGFSTWTFFPSAV